MTLRRLLLVAPLVLLLALALTDTAAAAPTQGSGRVQSETRKVSGFEAITATGSMKIVLHQGARESLELRADDNLLPLIETRVVDRDGVATLEIGPARHADWSTRNEITVTVDLVTLKALTVDGSGHVLSQALKAPSLRVQLRGAGDLHIRQLDVDDLSVNLSGSGDVDLAGRARHLKVAIAGSGDVKAQALKADAVSVSIAGSGDASVDAQQTLVVSIAGSGAVTYSGDASVKTSIAGSGTVKRR